MDNPVTLAILGISLVIFYGWVAWVVLEWRKLTRKAQLHKTLIERFSSSGDLQAFLTSEGGERLLQSLSIGAESPKAKILSSFSRGIIVALLGISLLAVSFVLPEQASLFLAGGIIVIALGAGLLISGLLSLRIGRSWGLFDK